MTTGRSPGHCEPAQRGVAQGSKSKGLETGRFGPGIPPECLDGSEDEMIDPKKAPPGGNAVFWIAAIAAVIAALAASANLLAVTKIQQRVDALEVQVHALLAAPQPTPQRQQPTQRQPQPKE